MMKHIFIINPCAGKKDNHIALSEKIHSYFKGKNENYEIFITKYEKNATEIAYKACTENAFCRLYAFGGDGTLNEVIEGAYTFRNCEIGVYPCGTGNDFVKSLSEKKEMPTIEELVNAKSIECDMIKVNDRVGINVCSIGFDSFVAKNVKKFKRFFGGALAYNLSLAYSFLTKTKFSLEIIIDDGQAIKGDFIFTVIANGKHYGGSFLPAPEANINDGVLDFVLIKAVSRATILKLIESYKKGTHIKLTHLVTYIKGKKIKVSSKDPIYCNIDGEVLKLKEAEFEILPSQVKIIVPSA